MNNGEDKDKPRFRLVKNEFIENQTQDALVQKVMDEIEKIKEAEFKKAEEKRIKHEERVIKNKGKKQYVLLNAKLLPGPNSIIFGRDAVLKSVVIQDMVNENYFAIDIDLQIKKAYSIVDYITHKPCVFVFYLYVPNSDDVISILLDISIRKQNIFVMTNQKYEKPRYKFDHILLERSIKPKINATIRVDMNYK